MVRLPRWTRFPWHVGDNFLSMARDPHKLPPLHLHSFMSLPFHLLINGLAHAFAFCLMLCCTVEVHAQDAKQLIAMGDSLLALDKPQRALDAYDQAVQKNGTAEAHIARARAYYELERWDLYLKDVDKALLLDTGYADAHYHRALYAYRADDLGTADYHASKALDHATVMGLRTKILLLRGETRAEMKRIGPAIADLEAGTAEDDSDVDVLRVLARLYDSAGRHEDALTVLTKLCERDSTDVGHWSNRSFELIALERYPEALIMVEKALDIDKDEPVALSNRAYIFYTMDMIKEATQDIDRSLRFYPANPYALRTRALLRIRKGDREKACEDLTLAKALGEIPDVDRLVKEHCATESAPR